jgi:hypothetical protein
LPSNDGLKQVFFEVSGEKNLLNIYDINNNGYYGVYICGLKAKWDDCALIITNYWQDPPTQIFLPVPD